MLRAYAHGVGKELSPQDLVVLGTENPIVDDATEARLLDVTRDLISSQRQSGEDESPTSFTNGMEWAGDGEYPYVVALAEAAYTGRPIVRPRTRRVEGLPVVLVLLMTFVLLIWGVVFLLKRFL